MKNISDSLEEILFKKMWQIYKYSLDYNLNIVLWEKLRDDLNSKIQSQINALDNQISIIIKEKNL